MSRNATIRLHEHGERQHGTQEKPEKAPCMQAGCRLLVIVRVTRSTHTPWFKNRSWAWPQARVGLELGLGLGFQARVTAGSPRRPNGAIISGKVPSGDV